MIHPTTPQTFYNNYFEKKPLIIKRKNPSYYDNIWDREMLDKAIRANNLVYGVDINLVNYNKTDDLRSDFKEGEPVDADAMWNAVDNEKCSVRVLRPQEYNENLSRMLGIFDEYFMCNAGVNSYYTPKGSQGFAPHWDDVDTFILQTEGAKRWRVYRTPDTDYLPRYSSGDFKQDEPFLQKPFLDELLHAGDLLYMPRGWIHQGYTNTENMSNHVTVSANQGNTWADY